MVSPSKRRGKKASIKPAERWIADPTRQSGCGEDQVADSWGSLKATIGSNACTLGRNRRHPSQNQGTMTEG